MSDDIFSEMVADASAFDTVSTEGGSNLSNLIRAAQHQNARDGRRQCQRGR